MTVAELHEVLEQDDCLYNEQHCERFSALLENDLQALDRIQFQEQRWKAGLKNKEISFDFDLERQITSHYGKWLRNAGVRLEQIKMERQIGCDPNIAALFEKRVDDAKETYVMRVRSEAAALARYRMLHEEG
jgi:hypothetical protein